MSNNPMSESHKKCTGCKETKPIGEFYESKRNKSGRVARCITCTGIQGREWYERNKERHKMTGDAWKAKNKERHGEYVREYNRVNHDKILDRRREYKKENKGSIAQKNREYQARTREKRLGYERAYISSRRAERNAYLKTWRKRKRETDPLYRIKCQLRCRLAEVLKTSGLRKAERTMDLLGCTVLAFRDHIQSIFYGDMTWENMGLGHGKWQIDHKVAIGLFDLSQPSEQKACFHWTNLQPLSHKDHLVKSKQDNQLIRLKKQREQTAA